MSLAGVLPLSRNKIEVLKEIYLAQEDYLRQLEKKTGINPSLLHRILKELAKKTIILKQRKGKEIYYSLSSEQKEFWREVIETYRKDKTLEKHEDLRVVYKLLINHKKIWEGSSRIYLFGSFAKGEVNELSDMDILFVSTRKKEILAWCRETSAILNREISPLVYSPFRFSRTLEKGETLLTSIVNNIKNRIILKEQ